MGGSTQNNLGKHKIEFFAALEKAKDKVERIKKQKRNQNYEVSGKVDFTPFDFVVFYLASKSGGQSYNL